MSERDRVTERRIDLSLPLVEGAEDVPDLTANVLDRLRAEGMLPRRTTKTWIAAALLLLGIGVALGVAIQGLGETDEVPVAGTDQGSRIVPPPLPAGQPPLANFLPGQDPVRGTPRYEPPGSEQKGSGGNSWFEATDLDLGTIYYRERATGTFSFRNPTDRAVQLTNLRQSCTCTRATLRIEGEEYYLQATSDAPSVLYHVVDRNGVRNPERVNSIPVAPGAEGTVEVEMEMSGVRGLRGANISFETADPDLPYVRLNFEATGATYFSIEPQEINLGTMFWNEKQKFTAKVTSPVLGDFNILRHDPLPQGMEVDYKKNMLDGRAEYTITGTYGPVPADSGSGGRLVFHTEHEGLSFDLRVLAVVEGPLRLVPGEFLSLGRIPVGESAARSVTLESTDGFELEVEKIESKGLSFDKRFLDVSSTRKGKVLEITVRVLPGVASGTVVRGDIVIHVDHPGAPTTTILFNGFVR